MNLDRHPEVFSGESKQWSDEGWGSYIVSWGVCQCMSSEIWRREKRVDT